MSTQDVTGADLFAPLRGSGNPEQEPRVGRTSDAVRSGVGGDSKPKPKAKLSCADDVRDNMPLFRGGYGGANPTSALHLNIRECGMRRARELNQAWHSVLPETHLGNLVGNERNVAYEAQVTGIAFAVAIWTTPIAANRLKDGWLLLELRRLAIADDAPKNTASRMLAVMTRMIRKKWPELLRLVSYQAEKHHAGTIYKAAGWKVAATSDAMTWHEGESRADMQTDSRKIRWELELRAGGGGAEPGANVIERESESGAGSQNDKLSDSRPL